MGSRAMRTSRKPQAASHKASNPPFIPLCKRGKVGDLKGFTLVEILVAITILAVVLSTIYVSFISTMRIVKSLEYGDEIYYMARITLERMVLDLQSACKERDSYEFVTQPDPTGKLPFKGVSFLSRAHLDFTGSIDSLSVAQISYELEGDADSGGFSITRRDVLRQGQGTVGGEGHLLCRRLQFINIRFYDSNGREYTQWDSRSGAELQRNKVPASIFIELNFINPDDGANPYKFMTRMLLTGALKT